ncbi:class I mannose-6-phosphate isomerase [Lysinibacter cavernae]|uniref:Mannose-6-phosphate isomerase n=1 Tax=Lysinibacter cavernae TaxID=1640652 RepID=A0A7X5TVG4_9MICO|nr:class I mannose-6-phosphate isomerase [Lysinibacter cavernae]NIH55132.1 mannose-6-phosphate isomerase [Lysinibacter cavernae]
MEPIFLPSNQPRDRFYQGGKRIQQLRGEPLIGNRVPEDWVGSCTALDGHSSLGTTTLPDGTLLADAVTSNPIAWLGPHHVAAYGADPKMLVKLLDAGQRLPVHAHPHASFAHEHLGRHHGKAEAWYVLEPGDVYVGLKQDLASEDMLGYVKEQDSEQLLGLLHRRHVERGDSVYVPPGVLHAIGEGILVAEIQEPEDMSILLEWNGFELDGERDGHLGLGFERALGAVELLGRSEAEVDALITRGKTGPSVLASESNEYFRVESYRNDDLPLTLDAGLRILIVAGGSVTLHWEEGHSVPAPRGSTVLIPSGVGPVRVTGEDNDTFLVICRPPL